MVSFGICYLMSLHINVFTYMYTHTKAIPIIYAFCSCEFVYLITFICNLNTNTWSIFAVFSRNAQYNRKLRLPRLHSLSWGWTRLTPCSCVSQLLCFCNVFCAMLLIFLCLFFFCGSSPGPHWVLYWWAASPPTQIFFLFVDDFAVEYGL